MRLIDADALEKEICPGCDYYKNKYANCVDCAIANAPTIDAEPVVRCYECKYEEKCEREVMWKNDSYRGILTFCSYGERREG